MNSYMCVSCPVYPPCEAKSSDESDKTVPSVTRDALHTDTELPNWGIGATACTSSRCSEDEEK